MAGGEEKFPTPSTSGFQHIEFSAPWALFILELARLHETLKEKCPSLYPDPLAMKLGYLLLSRYAGLISQVLWESGVAHRLQNPKVCIAPAPGEVDTDLQ